MRELASGSRARRPSSSPSSSSPGAGSSFSSGSSTRTRPPITGRTRCSGRRRSGPRLLAVDARELAVGVPSAVGVHDRVRIPRLQGVERVGRRRRADGGEARRLLLEQQGIDPKDVERRLPPKFRKIADPRAPSFAALRREAAELPELPAVRACDADRLREGRAGRPHARRRAARATRGPGGPSVRRAGREPPPGALAEAGLADETLYVTNAVKHFKWRRPGKRRIHDKPSWSEIKACGHWLRLELASDRAGARRVPGGDGRAGLLGSDARVGRLRGSRLGAEERRAGARDDAPVRDSARRCRPGAPPQGARLRPPARPREIVARRRTAPQISKVTKS